jgi:hypothetical protein
MSSIELIDRCNLCQEVGLPRFLTYIQEGALNRTRLLSFAHSLKVIITEGTIIGAFAQATVLEIYVLNCMGINRFYPIFPVAPSRLEQTYALVSPVSLTDILCGVCWNAQKQCSSSLYLRMIVSSLNIVQLLLEIRV